jgi:hypothetical protein
MEENLEVRITVKETFDSLYKLGYFLIDLNSICNFSAKINKQNVEEARKSKKTSFGITSRNYNKDSLEIIKLVEFSQGSFLATIIAPLIVGIILIVITKYINQGQNQNKIEVIVNNQTINNIVNVSFNSNLSLNENFDNVLNELVNKKLVDQCSIIYNEDGKKILFHNIDRLKGQLVDKKW